MSGSKDNRAEACQHHFKIMQGFGEGRGEKNGQADNSQRREKRAPLGGAVFDNGDARDRQGGEHKRAMDPFSLGDHARERQDSGKDRQGETMDEAQPRQGEG